MIKSEQKSPGVFGGRECALRVGSITIATALVFPGAKNLYVEERLFS